MRTSRQADEAMTFLIPRGTHLGKLVKWLAPSLALLFASSVHGEQRAKDVVQRHVDGRHGWSIQIPGDWAVNETQGTNPEILSAFFMEPKGRALCSTREVKTEDQFKDSGGFADFMIKHGNEEFAKSGIKYNAFQKRTAQVAGLGPAIKTFCDPEPGGKCIALYAVKAPYSYVVLCETSDDNWPSMQATLDRIVESFQFSR